MGRRGCSRPVVAASWLTTREASRGKRWTMNLHEDGGRGRVARGPPPSCTGAATELHGGRHRAAQMVHMRPWPETATRRRELILGDSGGRGVAQGRDELGSDTGYMGPWPMKMWSGSHTSRRLGVEKNLAGRHRLTESCTMEWAHSKGGRGSPPRGGRGASTGESSPIRSGQARGGGGSSLCLADVLGSQRECGAGASRQPDPAVLAVRWRGRAGADLAGGGGTGKGEISRWGRKGWLTAQHFWAAGGGYGGGGGGHGGRRVGAWEPEGKEGGVGAARKKVGWGRRGRWRVRGVPIGKKVGEIGRAHV